MKEIVVLFSKYLFLLSITVAAFWTLISAKKHLKAIVSLVIVSFPAAFIFAKVLNHFFYNARPFVVEDVKPFFPHAADNGFPSDHTLLTMTIAAAVFTFNKKIGLILAALSLVIGYSRVIAKVHHQIDIWGAVLIAISAVYLSNLFLTWLRGKFARRTKS